MIRSVAVTTDFSDLSVQPFEAAATLSRKFGAGLVVVHVLPEPEIYTSWQVVRESSAARQNRLEKSKKRLQQIVQEQSCLASLDVRTAILSGPPAESVADFGDSEGIDLLIVASHGHTGMTHFPLGSFTARVLEFSRCPVLVFRTRESAGAPFERAFTCERILVAHDFSPASTLAVRMAREWAKAFEADTRIVFVMNRSEGRMLGDDGECERLTAEELRSKALHEIERIADSEWRGLPLRPVIRTGHPAVEILKEEKSCAAEMIIMGSRGLSPFGRLEMGSVAERVVQGARCPVLVNKAAARRT